MKNLKEKTKMFSPSSNKLFREVDLELFLEHLQKNHFEYILPINECNGIKNHIFFHSYKGILCGVQEGKSRNFNACYMEFEVETPNYESIWNLSLTIA